MPDSPARTLRVIRGAALAMLLGACSDSPVLPPAQIPVADQQITLYALNGTPVNTPSAYSLFLPGPVRLDQTSDFDFAFDIRPDSAFGLGQTGDTIAALMPRYALGFTADGGIQTSTLAFDSITAAPSSGYDAKKPVQVRDGSVLFLASRVQTCNFSVVLPHYAKMVVQQIDFVLRTATIHVVLDPNCGYRSLAPGIPSF
jgi:hypothetical protein